MRTREFLLPGFDYPVHVHHDGDWSGNVIVQWTDNFHLNQQVEFPARLLLALSFKETKDYVLAELALALDRLAKGHHDHES